MPGFSVGKKEDKLGIRASSTCELVFDACRVPKSQVLGEVGKGYKTAIETLNEGRIGIGAQMIGLARGALEHAIRYTKERKQFGKAIADFKVSSSRSRAAMEIEAATLTVYNAARLRDARRPFLTEAAICKIFSSEVAERVSSLAVNLLGGNGFVKEHPVEKLFRDAKIGKSTRARPTCSCKRLPSRSWVSRSLTALLLFALASGATWLVHRETLGYGFDYDDYYFLRPPYAGTSPRDVSGPWDTGGVMVKFYRPLTIVLHAIFDSSSSASTPSRIMMSLALFALAAGLVGWLVYGWTRAMAGAIAAVLVVSHPAMPYSLVAWITNQMHLAQTLIVLTALVWWHAVRAKSLVWWLPLPPSASRPSWSRRMASCCCRQS